MSWKAHPGLLSSVARLSPVVINIPINTVAPVLSGIPEAEQTLNGTTGTWENDPDDYDFQWFRGTLFDDEIVVTDGIFDGTPIPTATNANYNITEDDIGERLYYEVIASNEFGSAMAQSNATDIIESGEPVEILATYTVTSEASGYTGYSGDGSAMRDGLDTPQNKAWASSSSSGGSITAILPELSFVDYIEVMPVSPGLGWGPSYTNGADILVSTDGSSFSSVGTITGATNGTLTQHAVGANATHVRLTKTSDWFGVGDFRIWGS